MTRKNWKTWLACGLAGLLTGGSPGMVAAQSAPLPQAPREAQQSGDVLIRLANETLKAADDAEPLPRSDYWIGIAIGSLPDVAKAQLNLEQGLVVAEVMENSPAAKAEFKIHDIMIKAGEAKIESAADLIKAVDAAKENELAVVILRGGKEQTIKVKPIKRPKTEAVGLGSDLLAPATSPDVRDEIKKLEQALSKLKEKAGDSPLGIVLARPGVVPHVNVYRAPDFPKNLSISISKSGGGPTKIHVEKDGREWDVTEEKLSELPEDVRVHVQQFFARPHVFRYATPADDSSSTKYYQYQYPPGVPGTSGAPGTPAATPRAAVRAYAVPVPPTPATPATPVAPPQAARTQTYRVETANRAVDSKLDAILKKLDALDRGSLDQLQNEVKQLRKELDELRGKSKVERDE